MKPDAGEDLLVAGLPRARDRVTARLRSRSLDRALARGTPSEATPALALRARRLIALPYRRSIADAYHRLVRESHEPARPSPARVVPRRSRVTRAADELTRLADTLTQTTPVTAQGVARALLLLADGTGPLYDTGSEESLRQCIARTTGELVLPDGPRPV